MRSAVDYYADKKQRAENAVKMTEEREKIYAKQINSSFRDTVLYNLFSQRINRTPNPDIEIIMCDLDSVSAIKQYKLGKTAVLNFASFTNPGGRYLDGSSAQAEALCEHSTLFNVLRKCEDYYKQNNREKNRGLYKNRLLYTPNVIFDDEVECDVVTCAAPNYSLALRYGNFSDEENTVALRERIEMILNAADTEKVDTFILGAFGCGVFKQDAAEVAMLFAKNLVSGGYGFKRVVFAVPKGLNSYNYDEFNKLFGD